MANEQQVKQQGKVNPPEPVRTTYVIDDAQFQRFLRVQILTGIISGFIASGRKPTANPANLKEALAYAEAIAELVGVTFVAPA